MTVNTDISYISEFERDIITLAYGGVSFDGIAHRYNIPVDSICKIYHDALEKAEKMIDKKKRSILNTLFIAEVLRILC